MALTKGQSDCLNEAITVASRLRGFAETIENIEVGLRNRIAADPSFITTRENSAFIELERLVQVGQVAIEALHKTND
jgi:hypothetical protein